MKPSGWKEISVLLLCISIPCYIACGFRQTFGKHILLIDLGGIYYGARCAMHHCDPYHPPSVLQQFQADGGHFIESLGRGEEVRDQIVVTSNVNLPTALFLAVPLALLPWGLAQDLWMILTAALLVAAAYLTWDLGAGKAPLIWAALAGFMLADSHLLFQSGNIAGIVCGLCVIAVWCFLEERYTWLGVLMLAISLVLKPHDSGFIWLYFLLAGGTLRRRALQTLAFAGVLAACAAIWITTVSPRWTQELHANLTLASVRGRTSDPGPAGISANGAAAIIDLQGVLSSLKDDPHFYDPFAWLIAGLPILALSLATLRKAASPQGTLLALAALSALSLLPVYHRSYDALLLLLSFPACITLWKRRAPERWLALVLTSGAVLLTATTPLAFLSMNFQALAGLAAKLPGKLPAILLLRPTPCILLAMGCFYLWAFLRYTPPGELPTPEGALVARAAAQVM